METENKFDKPLFDALIAITNKYKDDYKTDIHPTHTWLHHESEQQIEVKERYKHRDGRVYVIYVFNLGTGWCNVDRFNATEIRQVDMDEVEYGQMEMPI